MRQSLVIGACGALVSLAGCSESATESQDECRSRFEDGAEVIESLDNEYFDAIFTYEMPESFGLEEIRESLESQDETSSLGFNIVDGAVFKNIRQNLQPSDDVIAIGCSLAPTGSKLVRIERSKAQEERD